MTLLRSVVLSVAGVAISLFVLGWIQNLFQIPLTAETESKFFRSYDPLVAVNSLRLGCYPDGKPTGQPTSVGTGESHSAGNSFWWARRDAEHRRSVEPFYCANAAQNAALYLALRENALVALRNSMCIVSDDRMSDQNGLRIMYRCGEHSSGVVTIAPPKHDSSGDANHQVLSVQVDEHWSPRA
jgi:hypothetical protein